jgi:hypothetical protein
VLNKWKKKGQETMNRKAQYKKEIEDMEVKGQLKHKKRMEIGKEHMEKKRQAI